MEYKINHKTREIEIFRDKDSIDPIIIDFDTFLEMMADIRAQINEYLGNII